MQNSSWLGGYKVNDRLVVFEINVLPFNFLFGVLFLLQLKDVLVEEVLQCFIGIVDTQLFKAVVMEVLQKEVKHFNGRQQLV